MQALKVEEVQVMQNIQDPPKEVDSYDSFDSYFECITSCSLDNEGVEKNGRQKTSSDLKSVIPQR